MDYSKDLKVADIVTLNIKTADVFKKHGIDFCCGGGISIEKACEKNKVDLDLLLSELNTALKSKNENAHDFSKWNIDFLASYIINVHHKYVLEAIELLDAYSSKVVSVHGKNHTDLYKIADLYNEVKAELIQHMQKEENVLFPYIISLANAQKLQQPLPTAHFGSVKNPIQMMQMEHENAGNILQEIATLTSNYSPPEWACNTFKAFYAKLDEFEKDLHIHVHLENNILFPKAILIEQLLVQQTK